MMIQVMVEESSSQGDLLAEFCRPQKLLNEALERNLLFKFLILAVIKIFQIEKFLMGFRF